MAWVLAPLSLQTKPWCSPQWDGGVSCSLQQPFSTRFYKGELVGFLDPSKFPPEGASDFFCAALSVTIIKWLGASIPGRHHKPPRTVLDVAASSQPAPEDHLAVATLHVSFFGRTVTQSSWGLALLPQTCKSAKACSGLPLRILRGWKETHPMGSQEAALVSALSEAQQFRPSKGP